MFKVKQLFLIVCYTNKESQVSHLQKSLQAYNHTSSQDVYVAHFENPLNATNRFLGTYEVCLQDLVALFGRLEGLTLYHPF